MKELEYPFDSELIRKKRIKYRKLLLENNEQQFAKTRIAILGGSTTSEVKNILELFLLNNEIDIFHGLGNHLFDKYHCSIIQNNFEMPYWRLLGNQDAALIQGRCHYVNLLNERICVISETSLKLLK